MITALGRAIRSNSSAPANNPLAGYTARYLFLTGYSEGALALQTYNNAVAPNTTLFDAYMPIAGLARRGLNSCLPAVSAATFRTTVHSRTAAVMQVQTESEANLFSLVSFNVLHMPHGEDSDAPDNRYRYYEIAGATHLDQNLLNQEPQHSDLARSGGDDFDAKSLPSQCYGALTDIFPTARLNAFPDFVPYDAI